MHIFDFHSKLYQKCNLCPSAFKDEVSLIKHWSESHKEEKTLVKTKLYKLKIYTETKFYTNQTSFLQDATRQLSLPKIFVFTCLCQEMFWSSYDLVYHLEKSDCDVNSMTSEFFKPKEEGTGDHEEVMENLRFLQVWNSIYVLKNVKVNYLDKLKNI